MTPPPDERDRIRAAMDRILDGTPRNSGGALTIVALAQEAGVVRNALTQRHPDLKNEFYDRVQQRGATPDVETRLRQSIVKLKQTIANKNMELNQLRTDVPSLVRAVNQLSLENEELRKLLNLPSPNVIPLHNGQRPRRD
jgi:chromosome segregation ATPase